MSYTVLSASTDKAAWLAARRTGISASDVACLVGVGYMSRNELLKEKLGCGDDADELGNMAQVQAGRHFEDGLIAWFKEAHTLDFQDVVGNRNLLASAANPRIMATPDAFATKSFCEVVPVEAKCVGYETQYGWRANTMQLKGWPKHLDVPEPVEVVVKLATTNTRVAKADAGSLRGQFREHIRAIHQDLFPQMGEFRAPLKYLIQLTVQMYVMGAQEGWITVALGGTSRVDLRYERDPVLEEYWLELCDGFLAEMF